MRRSLTGSIVGHAVLMVGLLLLTSSSTLRRSLEPQAVALVFELAPPAPAAQVPTPPAPAPAQQTPPPPHPVAPTHPQPRPELPAPPTPQATPEPPPPPEPQTLPEELPLPPPPAPEPPPLPVRRSPPPGPSATPPRSQPPQNTPTPTEAQPTQAASPSGPPAPVLQAVIAPSWQSALGAWLEAHKSYPEEARRRGDQGHAVVRFKVDRTGRVLDTEIISGTGSAILDDAVESMLRGARVPAFPPGMEQDQVTVTVQLSYKLE